MPTTSTATTSAVVLDDGHVDYAVRLNGNRLESRVKDGTQAGKTVWRDPSTVVFHVKPAAMLTIPSDRLDFLGPAGSTIWQIPQTQRQGILWLGWNTEEITATQLRGAITWTLEKMDGPGRAAVFVYDALGQPNVVFSSHNGVPDQYTVGVGTHAHGNWAFTKEGVYKLTFKHTATLANGTSVSDTATVTVAVGNTDPRPLATGTTTTTSTSTSCHTRLAKTGSSIVTTLAVGGGMVVLGVAALGLAGWRRRRSG